MVKEVEVKYTDVAIIKVTTLFSDAIKSKEELIRMLSGKWFRKRMVTSLKEVVIGDRKVLRDFEKLLQAGYTKAEIVHEVSSGGLAMTVLRMYNGKEVLVEKGIVRENLREDASKIVVDFDAELKDWELLLEAELAHDTRMIRALKSKKFFKRF